ncbi:MAG: hypothetical protein PHT32_02410 [Candidatus Omnitrophica bacterium]|nr:hypothetical protein [Candidatus Omnitrophota bacterium]
MSVRKNAILVFSVIFLINCSAISPSAFANPFSIPKVLPGESQEIQLLGSTVNIKGITDQDNVLRVNGRNIIIQKDGSFQDDVLIPLGDTEIQVTATNKDGKVKTYAKKITAKENHFFMVGLADGTLNFSQASEGVTWERDGKHFKNGFNADGKLAYYCVGKILGKILIKSQLDTDKATQEKLFTYIDPDKYYPVYGDDSTVVYDVNSQGKFYLLLEWDRSGITVGNFQTQIGGEKSDKIAKYNRTLYGGKIQLESTQRTIYGEPITKAAMFAAEANQHAGHNEFLATGTSLYYLRHRNIVEGSEQVRIDVRDKNTGITLYSINQAVSTDYQIKYDQGNITFNKPVLAVAASDTIISSDVLNGNPVYVVVNYEYKDQNAFPISIEEFGQRTGGLNITQNFNNFGVGVTYVQEANPNDSLNQYQMYGIDGTVKIGNFTKATIEAVGTQAATAPLYISYNGGYDFTTVTGDNALRDHALKINVNSSIGEYLGLGRGYGDFSFYYQYIGKNFVTSDSLFQAGTEKYGFEFAHKLTENDNIRFIYEKKALESTNKAAQNQVTAGSEQDFTGQWTHKYDKFDFITEFASKDKTDVYSYYGGGQHRLTENTIAERVQYNLNKITSLFIGEQITVDGGKARTSAGVNTKLSDGTKAMVECAAGNDGNSVSAAFDKAVGQEGSVYTNYTFTDSVTDGKSSTTSFGSNTALSPNAKLNTERQFITSDIRGAYTTNLMGLSYSINPQAEFSATYQRRNEGEDYNLMGSIPQDAFSFNGSYIAPDKFKLVTKEEYRRDQDKTWQILTDNTGEVKVFGDVYLFGECEYSIAYTEGANDSCSKIDKKQVGLAYRPVAFDWFNGLIKYIRYIDERPDSVTSADGGFLTMQSTSDTFAAEAALDLPWNFQLVQKLAYKYEKTLSYDPLGIVETPDDLTAKLWITRLNYHLTKKWDAAFEYRVLQEKGPSLGATTQHREDGFLVEANYLIAKGIAVGAGYNFTSFADNLDMKLSDIADKNQGAGGFFVRLQGRY